MKYIIIIGLIAMAIAWIVSVVILKIEVDTTAAIIYGIYGLIIITFWIFVLIGLQQGWIEE